MSWYSAESSWRMGVHPGAGITGPYFTNRNGYYAYYAMGGRVISTTFGYGLVIDGSPSYNNMLAYNGNAGFDGVYGFWYDLDFGWVAARNLTPGSPLSEIWIWEDAGDTSKGGNYYGTAFYTLGTGTGVGSSFPSYGSTVIAYGRGSNRVSNNQTSPGFVSSNTRTVSTLWSYWFLSSGISGVYFPRGTASGNKYLGSPQWTYSGGGLFTRSTSKDSTSHYTYGSIRWDTTAGGFVFGTYNSDTGWWQTSTAPTSGSSWTLTFTVPSGSTVTGSDVTLSWNGYVLGSSSISGYSFRASKMSAVS